LWKNTTVAHCATLFYFSNNKKLFLYLIMSTTTTTSSSSNSSTNSNSNQLPSFEIVSLWKRSADSEGNPMHKPQTREPFPKEKRINVNPIDGLEGSSDWHRDRQV
jgi:hypothetical protein